MYRTLLALLFSGISLLSHADNSYLIQARIRDVKDGTVFFLKQFSTQRIINAMRLEAVSYTHLTLPTSDLV